LRRGARWRSRAGIVSGAGRCNRPDADWMRRCAVAEAARLRSRLGGGSRVPDWAARACYLLGLLDVLGVVRPGMQVRLHEVGQFVPGVTHTAAAATLVSGILLLLLAHSLRRRKRRAWLAVFAILAVSVALHLLRGRRPVEIV